MSMATLTSSAPISAIFSSISSHQIQGLNSQFTLKAPYNIRTTTSSKRLALVQASKTPTEEASNSPSDKMAIVSQEDLTYLVKLGACCFVGAAAIKYGSVVFPDITRPNIAQALIMISAPVVLAVVLLIKQSRAD